MRKMARGWRDTASASGDPAMVSGFRMASILSLQVTGTLPAFRPAAGLLLDDLSEHGVFCVMLLCIIGFETVKRRWSNDNAKTRAN
jgi:hypothetical protein